VTTQVIEFLAHSSRFFNRSIYQSAAPIVWYLLIMLIDSISSSF